MVIPQGISYATAGGLPSVYGMLTHLHHFDLLMYID
jgi:MFS superfamily sulfate permease-like transporter